MTFGKGCKINQSLQLALCLLHCKNKTKNTLVLCFTNDFFHREEENGALPGVGSAGPRPSLSAQHQPQLKKQLHYHTDGGMLLTFIVSDPILHLCH